MRLVQNCLGLRLFSSQLMLSEEECKLFPKLADEEGVGTEIVLRQGDCFIRGKDEPPTLCIQPSFASWTVKQFNVNK